MYHAPADACSAASAAVAPKSRNTPSPVEQQPASQQQQQQQQPTMPLAELLGVVDSLERGAVLKTFRCEEERDGGSGRPLSRVERCALLSQALTLLVRASDMVRARLVAQRREEAAVAGRSAAAAAGMPLYQFVPSPELPVLQRRSEQLQQHVGKVRTLLAAAEAVAGCTRVGAGRERSTSTVRDDDDHIQRCFDLGRDDGSSARRSSSSSRSSNNGSYLGGSSARDDNHSGGDAHFHRAGNRRAPSLDMLAMGPVDADDLAHMSVGASRAASLDGAYSAANTSLARQQPQRMNAQQAHPQPDDECVDVRLCLECLETTFAQAPFCHNCGKAMSATATLVRAPSADPARG